MNPLTNMKNIQKLSEQELKANSKTSWHDQYKDSAWVFVGGLPYDLTEGDIICIFSQYGEIVNINLIRDKDTGKSKGFCFICYEDQRSTILVVDNFNGIKILGRTIRVDHVSDYKVPKEGKKTDEETKRLYSEGCAPQATIAPKLEINPVKVERDDVRETLADQISGEIRLPARLPIYPIKQEKSEDGEQKKRDKPSKKKKKEKKKRSKKKKKSDSTSESESSESEEDKKSAKLRRLETVTPSKSRHSSNSESSDSRQKNCRKGEETREVHKRHKDYSNEGSMETTRKYSGERKRYDLLDPRKPREYNKYERSYNNYKNKTK